MKVLVWFLLVISVFCFPVQALTAKTRIITDMAGRKIEIPLTVDRVICSGPGCLRYLTYLQGQNLIVGVDSIEKRLNKFDARPYALANPQFKEAPLFGGFRGFDSPELILGLNPQPQVIFKTYKNMGRDPDELQAQTGIPVICLSYANLASERQTIYETLELMGEVIGKQERAAKVCEFIENTIMNLEQRTANIRESERPTCYVGGIAEKGPHGFQSTEPAYPPFRFVNVNNVACPLSEQRKVLQHANVSKEQIVAWNPEVIFVDLSTTQLGASAGAIVEIKTDPAYLGLNAVQNGRIYSVLPYNWYARNYGSIIADAFYVGKVLYPKRFTDVDPKVKADDIYTFLVGKPIFSLMDKAFSERAFEKLELR